MADAAIKVEGMSCQHCVMRVKKALQGLEGIREMDVQIGNVKVSFDELKIKKEDLEKAIIGAGYKIATL